MPLDSSAACVRVIHDAQPLWISMQEDEASRSLFANMHWQTEVLAVPLFGISEITSRPGAVRVPTQYWAFEPGARMGVLYVGANQETLDSESLTLLKRFANGSGS
jgi:hypothetical protein